MHAGNSQMIVFGKFYRFWRKYQRLNNETVGDFFSAYRMPLCVFVSGSKRGFMVAFVFTALGLACSALNSAPLPDGADKTGNSAEFGSPVNGMLCPPGPYASAPFTGSKVTAQPVAGSTDNLYSSGLIEGPVWIDGALYVSSFAKGRTPPSTILTLQPDGALTPVISNSGSNGLAIDAGGMIVAATHDDGGLSRFNPADGARTVIVNSFQGRRLNSPNDLTIAGDGTIFFTDPNWQAPSPDPQPVEGVYRVSPGGVITLLDGSINKPNGIALSNDETWLYVGHPGGMVRYAVTADLTVTMPSAVFGSGLAEVDGLAMDCAGNIYVTQYSAGVVAVLNPDGIAIGTIDVAPGLTNAAFGGPEGKTLFLTAGDPAAGDAVFAVELKIPGRPY